MISQLRQNNKQMVTSAHQLCQTRGCINFANYGFRFINDAKNDEICFVVSCIIHKTPVMVELVTFNRDDNYSKNNENQQNENGVKSLHIPTVCKFFKNDNILKCHSPLCMATVSFKMTRENKDSSSDNYVFSCILHQVEGMEEMKSRKGFPKRKRKLQGQGNEKVQKQQKEKQEEKQEEIDEEETNEEENTSRRIEHLLETSSQLRMKMQEIADKKLEEYVHYLMNADIFEL